MKTLDRYIGRAVLSGTLGALMVLLPLLSFLLLADELDYVGKGNFSLLDAFFIIGLSMPRYAYQIMPIAALIGSLFGLGNLAAHSELTAMRAAGVSVGRVVAAVLKAGLITAVVAVVIGEAIAPTTEQKANQLRAEALSEQMTLVSRYGFWARDGRSFINIRGIFPGGRLNDIYIYEFDDDKKLRRSTHAESAQFTGDGWKLQGISQSEISEQGVDVSSAGQAVWQSLLDPGMLSLLVVDPNVLAVWDLRRYIDFMQDNGLSALSYQVAFWGKIAAPVVILAMIFLSVPLLFGTLRSVGVGQRVFVGVLIGIAFYILNQTFSHLAVVYSISPMVSAFLPAVLCLAAASLVFRRVR